MSEARVTLRLDSRLWRSLRQRAKALGRNQSELLRLALENELSTVKEQPSCLELLLKHTRFIGSAKGLPGDTSTNPKYMEGFGADPE